MRPMKPDFIFSTKRIVRELLPIGHRRPGAHGIVAREVGRPQYSTGWLGVFCKFEVGTVLHTQNKLRVSIFQRKI